MPEIKKLLKEVLQERKISEREYSEIKNLTEDIVSALKNIVKAKKISADVFVGGSFAKNTMIKKQKHDIDIFIRFNKKYEENELSSISEKIINNLKSKEKNKFKIKKIHGSRDYFNISLKNKNIFFEVVPVVKIKNPKESKNVTDLSYFHVNYISKKIKKVPKLADEIVLLKTFCYAQECYGAESYINGFSGYAIELLICKYKTFLNFIKKVSKFKIKKEKIVIDLEKHYKSKQDVMLNMNESKLNSPIIFIDPTFKERNTLSALSPETFKKFQNSCREFLKYPSKNFFEKSELNIQEIKNSAKKRKAEYAEIKIKTDRQEGDVAGSKLLKFHNFLTNQIGKKFEIPRKEFIYGEKQFANIYLITKAKKEIIIQGPPINSVENVNSFKKKHKNCFIKDNIVYAREKPEKSIKQFLKSFKEKNKKLIKEMSITEIKIE